MAGIFGFFDYNKPGKGVEKDAPKKHAFFRFWELIWRKLSRLAILNLVYFALLLPVIYYLYFLLYVALSGQLEQGMEIQFSPLAGVLFSTFGNMPPLVLNILLIASCVLYGPLTCGFTYILRNYAREEHAWFTDFFAQARKNLKQGLFLGLLEILVLAVFFVNFFVKPDTENAGLTSMMVLARYLSIIALVLFSFMRNYYYIMAVTFDLRMRDIIKNAWIFSVLGLFRNILVDILILGTGFLIIFFGQWLELVLVPFIIFSLWGFLSVFTCYPVIDKYMLAPQLKADGDDEADIGNEGNMINKE